MIFVGDLASPNIESTAIVGKVLSENPAIFAGKKIVCNLEGLLYNGEKPKANEPLLYSHSSILKVFDLNQESVFCLANNHVLDMPHRFEDTVNLIQSQGHLYCGAGKSMQESKNPARFNVNYRDFLLFNACWDFLLYNHRNPRSGIHIAEIKEDQLLNEIKTCKEENPNCSIIVYLHWNLDLETLPFPMHRQFSRDLISSGADMVLGAHSHYVQGGEKYQNGYIIYGMGNFLIPDHVYAGGRLRFPSFAKRELVLEWDTEQNQVLCHWFEYDNHDNPNSLVYICSEDFNASDHLKRLSPYSGMSDHDYVKYYKANRRKKILIPVYRDYMQKRRNSLYTELLKLRARSAHFLAKLNLIKWQN